MNMIREKVIFESMRWIIFLIMSLQNWNEQNWESLKNIMLIPQYPTVTIVYLIFFGQVDNVYMYIEIRIITDYATVHP